MEPEKKKHSDELLNRIRNELTAILEGQASGDPDKQIPDEVLMSPNPLNIFAPLRATRPKKIAPKKETTAPKKDTTPKKEMTASKKETTSPKMGTTAPKKGTTAPKKETTAKPSSAGSSKRSFKGMPKASSSTVSSSVTSSTDRLAGGDNPEKKPSKTADAADVGAATSSSSFNMAYLSDYDTLPKDPKFRADFMESQAAKSIDDDLQKMQLELKQSYELFQGIGEKFDSVNFTGLKNRIRDLHLSDSNNEMGKLTTQELQTMFNTRFAQNRLDKLTADASQGFRRHPGEFGDIPELSTFFQACAQLEHGLGALRQQRQRNSELEKRLCWATEIAYDRMDEIRSAVGSDPEKNF
ncbi:hypothetical protein KR018_000238 [Drosophila ironensis]|nr:hypothetical protein KR018_000238 [Drosophila ironensis]